MYARILVPIDGTACSDNAMAHGIALAKALDSSVAFLFAMDTLSARQEGVVNMAEARQALLAQGRLLLDRAERAAAGAGIRSTGELVEDTAAEAIVERSADFDLVVMSSHGKGILKRLTVGSVTQAVLHRIRRPVLVVRCLPHAEAEDSAS
jgi:nucleotide-binding universal stress UspA family protein